MALDVLCSSGSTYQGSGTMIPALLSQPTDSSLFLTRSYINQRNREWNIVESEKALVVSETA